jgi:hypothetical protein
MASEHDSIDRLHEELRWHRDKLHLTESMLQAIAALCDQHRGVEVRGAIDKLHDLLRVPMRRPDASETPHVTALDEQLHEVLELLGDR